VIVVVVVVVTVVVVVAFVVVVVEVVVVVIVLVVVVVVVVGVVVVVVVVGVLIGISHTPYCKVEHVASFHLPLNAFVYIVVQSSFPPLLFGSPVLYFIKKMKNIPQKGQKQAN